MKRKSSGIVRALSLLLALVIAVSTFPISAFAAYDFSSIPDEMLDNVFLDALDYIGYAAAPYSGYRD